MEDYLMDREELAQFVDQLIAKKPLSATDQPTKDKQREGLMSDLDHSIRLSILHQLTDEQLDEFSDLLDRDDADADEPIEDEYEKFFQNTGIDITKTITNTATAFARVYLGESNG